jgi:hypothetical protein
MRSHHEGQRVRRSCWLGLSPTRSAETAASFRPSTVTTDTLRPGRRQCARSAIGSRQTRGGGMQAVAAGAGFTGATPTALEHTRPVLLHADRQPSSCSDGAADSLTGARPTPGGAAPASAWRRPLIRDERSRLIIDSLLPVHQRTMRREGRSSLQHRRGNLRRSPRAGRRGRLRGAMERRRQLASPSPRRNMRSRCRSSVFLLG